MRVADVAGTLVFDTLMVLLCASVLLMALILLTCLVVWVIDGRCFEHADGQEEVSGELE